MNLTCIVCFKPATILYQGTSLCGIHFERNWEYMTEGIRAGSIAKMKEEEERKKRGPSISKN